MNKLRKTTLAMVACVPLTMGVSGAVQADILATSFFDMTNFQILGSDGLILDANTDFSQLTFTSTADVVGNLGALNYNVGATNPPTNPINITAQCVGGGCPAIGEDVYPVLSGANGDPVGNYSAADQSEFGAPVANIAGFTSPADVASGSYIGIDSGSTDASANSNNNLNSSFEFVLTNDQATGITFEFDARSYLEAYVTLDEIFPGFATANMQVFFTVTDEVTGLKVLDWSPDGTIGTIAIGSETADAFDLNETISKNAPTISALTTGGIYTPGVAGSGFYSATSLGLTAGTLYQLSARINVNTDGLRLQQVPEPGVLALMGVGLLGLGAARRRRRVA